MIIHQKILPFFVLLQFVKGDFYKALVDLEDMLHTEAILIETLDNYIQLEQQKLDLLKKYKDAYEKQNKKASDDAEIYVANPINAYLLVKRLTIDWEEVESLVNTNFGNDFNGNVSRYREYLKFPTNEDLKGAADALTRLQDTYKLDTSSLARGELNGVKYSTELSAKDCFDLGRQSYNNNDFYHTRLWMREADARLGRELHETIDKSDILEYLAFSAYKQGNFPLALNLTNELLDIFPTHSRASRNKIYYEHVIGETNVVPRKGVEESSDANEQPIITKEDVQTRNASLFVKLCRKEIETPVKISSKLKCRYLNNNNPFLLIAPFKIEEAYSDPRILIFHDVLSDNEIKTILDLSRPRLKTSIEHNLRTGAKVAVPFRVSKVAWVRDDEHKLISNLCKRLQDMTGLTIETTEQFQIANYGIGGFYRPHFDYETRKGDVLDMRTGNRIATVLFYLSDVSQGGATAFPNIKVSLWPKKGTAAFWFNLHPSGKPDSDTLHGACPVLSGSKWICTKWFHEHGQEFLRPCSLTRTSRESSKIRSNWQSRLVKQCESWTRDEKRSLVKPLV